MRLLTILIGINTCCVILFMRETYSPFLERKWLVRRLAAEPSEKDDEADAIVAAAAPQPSFREIAVRTFTVSLIIRLRVSSSGRSRYRLQVDTFRSPGQRPPRLLMNPICAIFSSYYSLTYGAIYVFIVSA